MDLGSNAVRPAEDYHVIVLTFLRNWIVKAVELQQQLQSDHMTSINISTIRRRLREKKITAHIPNRTVAVAFNHENWPLDQ